MPRELPPLADERRQLIRWILNAKDSSGRYIGTDREHAQGFELSEPWEEEETKQSDRLSP